MTNKGQGRRQVCACICNCLHIAFRHGCFVHNSSIELPGCRKFFLKQVREEEEHATLLIDYANSRGGIVELQDIRAPKVIDWCSPLNALQNALELEMSVTKVTNYLHTNKHKFAQLIFLKSVHIFLFKDKTYETAEVPLFLYMLISKWCSTAAYYS
ncbi:soma ferritin-like [Schistocerca cancellata]|uniref:soma ferritin-like n=1 Tax=Schistocerca cancellata TaxID=274614 RepID=UPI002118C7FE|nr:soma ferritin-like [Schistocerca cancellata]